MFCVVEIETILSQDSPKKKGQGTNLAHHQYTRTQIRILHCFYGFFFILLLFLRPKCLCKYLGLWKCVKFFFFFNFCSCSIPPHTHLFHSLGLYFWWYFTGGDGRSFFICLGPFTTSLASLPFNKTGIHPSKRFFFFFHIIILIVFLLWLLWAAARFNRSAVWLAKIPHSRVCTWECKRLGIIMIPIRTLKEEVEESNQMAPTVKVTLIFHLSFSIPFLFFYRSNTWNGNVTIGFYYFSYHSEYFIYTHNMIIIISTDSELHLTLIPCLLLRTRHNLFL